MRVFEIPQGSQSIDTLRIAERPQPVAGPHEILVRVRATSLNYRDLLVASGTYFGGPVTRNLIPLSDGAGEVVAVGQDVSRFRVGERVAATFFQDWVDGPPAPLNRPAIGAPPVDGMLVQYVVLNERDAVSIPKNLSFEQAATLPCAGVTAWHALAIVCRVKAGESILVIGTGGVSILALQLAKAAGCRVFVVSSSDEKLQRAAKLGADGGVNYRSTPNWGREILELTGGLGVDHVVETGGPGTLAKSMECVAYAGHIALIGVVAGFEGDTNPHPIMRKCASMHGIFVGNRAMFEELNRAIEANQIEPVIDQVFDFDAAPQAYRYLKSAAHFGKVVIRV